MAGFIFLALFFDHKDLYKSSGGLSVETCLLYLAGEHCTNILSFLTFIQYCTYNL